MDEISVPSGRGEIASGRKVKVTELSKVVLWRHLMAKGSNCLSSSPAELTGEEGGIVKGEAERPEGSRCPAFSALRQEGS